MTGYDVVVLAGGSGRRLGGLGDVTDKALVDIGGRTLLARVLAASEGASRLVVVGPRRESPGPVVWCREEPPGGGPVAAIGAAWPRTAAAVVVVVAVDHPFVEVGTIGLLVEAVGDRDGACAVDPDGRTQPLLAAYRRAPMQAALTRTAPLAGARVRDLVAALDLAHVPVGIAAFDCDTPADVEQARATIARRQFGQQREEFDGDDA